MRQEADPVSAVEVRLIKTWAVDEIVDIYRAAGWWKDTYEPAGIEPLISGSFAFAVAVDPKTSRAVGMGRVISDGVSDGYIQDLAVLPEYRKAGVGRRIVSALIDQCKAAGLQWIGLIAEPGSIDFHENNGFRIMPGHIPMLYKGEL